MYFVGRDAREVKEDPINGFEEFRELLRCFSMIAGEVAPKD